MSKIRISDEFATSSTDFIRVATLEELKTARMLVVRGARYPLAETAKGLAAHRHQ